MQALITSIYFVPDPVGSRRHPARTGARRHPRARRPAEAAQEAREGAAGAHRRGRGRGARRRGPRARACSTPTEAAALRAGGRRTPVAECATRPRARRSRCAGWSRLRRRRGAPRRRPRASSAARSSRCSAPTAPASRRCAPSPRALVDASIGTVFLEGSDDHRHRVVPARPRRRPARSRGPRDLPRPHRRGEPRRCCCATTSSAPRPTSGSRSCRSGASRWPASSRVASSRC